MILEIMLTFSIILFIFSAYMFFRNIKLYQIRGKILNETKTTEELLRFRSGLSYDYMWWHFWIPINELEKELRLQVFEK